MSEQNALLEKSAPTEEKIKEAARRVFTQKGYAATRTRDIAEASGVNIALLNYYFRSKEKLYDIIMQEHMQQFLMSVMELLNNPNTSLHEKIEILVAHYIDMLIQNPDMPLFVLHELRNEPEKFIAKMSGKMNVEHSVMAGQWCDYLTKQRVPVNPIQIVLNLVAMTIFPFVASPMIQSRAGISHEQFNVLMDERKKLIPVWIKGMIGGQ